MAESIWTAAAQAEASAARERRSSSYHSFVLSPGATGELADAIRRIQELERLVDELEEKIAAFKKKAAHA